MSQKKIHFELAHAASRPPRTAPGASRRTRPSPAVRDLWPFLLFALLLITMLLIANSR